MLVCRVGWVRIGITSEVTRLFALTSTSISTLHCASSQYLRPLPIVLCRMSHVDSKDGNDNGSSRDKKKGGDKTREKKKGADKFSDSCSPLSVPITPSGRLKDFGVPMSDAYHPNIVENSWDLWWEGSGLYRPSVSSSHSDRFVMVIPPPNVTGTLHLGHALMVAIEDALTRWHRMMGHTTLWLPGTDHAGIATQVVVEKKIAREGGKTRHDLGREKFVDEVWKWKEQSGGRIIEQLRKMGASADWGRSVFTMDDKLSRAVKEAFIRMFNRGLIYRSNRLVNWSCSLRTAISSIEVEYIDIEKSTLIKVPGYDKPVEVGVLYSFAYKVMGESDKEIVVATTRIETLLGDVAVAVNSKDPRYQSLVGKRLIHPFVPSRVMTVITDDALVDMSFGTGAVKVTPAHDPNDFACGLRNKLEFINILTDEGKINENGGKFVGMKRFDVRAAIVEELKSLGLYRGKVDNKMSLGQCSRSKDIVEPVIRPQWWVSCQGMAKRAADSVRKGELKILPQFHEKTWFDWLDNIQDWCISRQLWWGHRIPAYLVQLDGKESVDEQSMWVVASSIDEARALAQAKFPNVPSDALKLTQDPDVLDTWFSSGLFPFSTMGWPDNTDDMKNFYPGSLLETGHDILFFWVARMVMMGLELTDCLPFHTVYLHAIVRDKFGEKMSKSKGNVIDPLDVVGGCKLEKLNQQLIQSNVDPSELKKGMEMQSKEYPDGIPECGADALRFGLLAYSAHGRDVNLDVQRVVAYRQFGNKLWQATRFALMKFDEKFIPPISEEGGKRTVDYDKVASLVSKSKSFSDRWILSRLHSAVEKSNSALSEFNFAEATTAIYNFWLYELCDVFLELIKPVMTGSDDLAKESSGNVLFLCLDHGLKLLHPMMPFITEELFHRLPGANVKGPEGSLLIGPYPQPSLTKRFSDSSAESQMKIFESIGRSSRSTRANLGLSGSSKKFDICALCANDTLSAVIDANKRDISVIAQASQVTSLSIEKKEVPPRGCVNSVITPELEIFIPLKGLVDFSAELVKIEKQMYKLQSTIASDSAVVNGPGFDKKPENVQNQMRSKLRSNEEELQKLKNNLNNFKSMMTPQEIQQFRNDKINALKTDCQKANGQIEKMKATIAGQKEPQKKVMQQMMEAETDVKKWEAEIEVLEKESSA